MKKEENGTEAEKTVIKEKGMLTIKRMDIEKERIIEKRRITERGSITLEATLMLTMFIMAYMCMMSLVQIVRAQTIMQYVVDQAALDISRSTYLLTKAGVTDQIHKTSKKGKKFEGDTADVVGNVNQLYKSLGAVTESTPDTIVTNTENVMTQWNATVDNVDEYVDTYFSTKDELWTTLTTWGKMKGEQFLTKEIVAGIVKNRVKRQLEVIGNQSADSYLKKLGVRQGLKGLTFDGTEWMQANNDGRPGIRIAMTYEMEYNWYYFLIKGLKYKVTAYTAVW